MGLLTQIPNPEDFITHLSEILGSEADETGLAGVLKNMNKLDISNLTSSTIEGLTNTISSEISIDPGEFTGGLLDEFEQAKQLIPEDPETLIKPLKDSLSELQSLTSLELSDKLLESIGAINNIQSLVPSDTRKLLLGASEGLIQLKDQFISGPWGEMIQWSNCVKGLYEEISLLFDEADSPEEILEKVIAFFKVKIIDLIKLILPQEKGLFGQLSEKMNDAISSEIVTDIQNLKTDLVDAFNQAKQEFENENFTNNALDEAEGKLSLLTDKIANVIEKMQQALKPKFAVASGMQDAIKQQLAEFKEIEIVDLGNIKDKFSESIQSAEETLRNLNLNVVKDTVENVFGKIDEVIVKFDIGKLTEFFNDLLCKIENILDGLQATLYEVVASIRNIFNQIKNSFDDVINALGEYENGEFHFFIEANITELLNKIKSTLNTEIKQYLGDFKDLVSEALQKINDILTPLKEKIDTVKNELGDALNDVVGHLEDVDIKGSLVETQSKIEKMFNDLGEIDFDLVVDPVIDEINEMRDDLNEIDTSSLNDYLRGLLKNAVEVVKKNDFPKDVTDYLLGQIDKILAIPNDGLKEIEVYVETGLERINLLEPKIILRPLSDLYNPIEENLDVIQINKLVEPLDKWHADLQTELDKISPAAVMQPVAELYEQLQSAFGSVSPEALVLPLQELIDNFKSEIQELDISSITKELDSALQSVKDTMEDLSPEKFFNPLINAYDKIEIALDRFNPEDLLEPFNNIFNKILEPLDHLNDAHVQLLGEAFAGIRSLPDTFDPVFNFQKTAEKYTEVDNLLEQINAGSIIADLKVPYDALVAAFENGGGTPGSDIDNTLKTLNPISNAVIAQAATEFQVFQSQLQTAFSNAEPTSELVNEFRLTKPDLELLVPTWLKDNMSVASVKAALIMANPLNLTDEINELYDAFKEQLQNFDPRILQENVKESYDKIKETFSGLDPQVMFGGVQDLLVKIKQQLDDFDLQFLVHELTELTEQAETLIQEMDPQQIINQLEQLTDEVQDLFKQLKPSLFLGSLNEPVLTVKEQVGAFDSMEFQEALQETFKTIHDIIKDIDIGILLKTLSDKLEELRNELKSSLERTETAFDGMIAAIPV